MRRVTKGDARNENGKLGFYRAFRVGSVQLRPQNTRILIMGIPEMVPPSFGKPPFGGSISAVVAALYCSFLAAAAAAAAAAAVAAVVFGGAGGTGAGVEVAVVSSRCCSY